MNLDSIDRKLTNILQTEFPLTPEPYNKLGSYLDISGKEVIHHIKGLKSKGIVRQISSVLDARRLGYRTTLVAMRVATSRLAIAEQVIMEHPQVSHCYERDHFYNFWFTLAVSATSSIEMELRQLTNAVHAEATLTLPATKLFKIGAYFAMDEDSSPADIDSLPGGVLPQIAALSQADRSVIKEVQHDLPLTPRPFTDMARRQGMNEEKFLTQCQSLLKRGIMRRFGAAINHWKAGFEANAMSCWAVPAEKVDMAAKKLASLPEVSHCYERKTNSLWLYNLFAMIHGRSKEACQMIASQVSDDCDLKDYVLLFSTREIKKTRIKYLV